MAEAPQKGSEPSGKTSSVFRDDVGVALERVARLEEENARLRQELALERRKSGPLGERSRLGLIVVGIALAIVGVSTVLAFVYLVSAR